MHLEVSQIPNNFSFHFCYCLLSAWDISAVSSLVNAHLLFSSVASRTGTCGRKHIPQGTQCEGEADSMISEVKSCSSQVTPAGGIVF